MSFADGVSYFRSAVLLYKEIGGQLNWFKAHGISWVATKNYFTVDFKNVWFVISKQN